MCVWLWNNCTHSLQIKLLGFFVFSSFFVWGEGGGGGGYVIKVINIIGVIIAVDII